MSIIGSNILAGASGQGGGYTIEESLRFNASQSSYLSWTPASAGNRKTWTWSGWVKRGTLATRQQLFSAYNPSNSLYIEFVNSTDTLRIIEGGGGTNLTTTQVFRDSSAWYHIVVAWDTTQATASNRVKIYLNGSQITSFGTSTYPTLNLDGDINNTILHNVGCYASGAFFFDGYLTEVNFIDGQALDPSSFGEFDAVTGVWKPVGYTGTYGTNGFYLPMKLDNTVEGFNTVTWYGTASKKQIGGVGFSPDLVWIKNRTSAYSHLLYDTIRGTGLYLASNSTVSDQSFANGLTSFDSDGFGVGTDAAVNGSGNNMVAWCWDAGSSTVSNTDGSITSSVRANPTYGFSIVSYTGDGNSSATVGHGLTTTAPTMVIIKNRTDGTRYWHCLTPRSTPLPTTSTFALGSGTNRLHLNSTDAESSYGMDPQTNASGNSYVAYCFSEVSGYSKFSSYTGTGASGNVVTTGFKPAFVMIKKASNTGAWSMFDANRFDGDNNYHLLANGSDAEYTDQEMIITDTGFTVGSTGGSNHAGETFIYMAFKDTREYAFWLDDSGNNNDWQPNGGITTQSTVTDTPTPYADGGNYAVLNPLWGNSNPPAFSSANLVAGPSGSGYNNAISTIAMPATGYWYAEFTATANVPYGGGNNNSIGVVATTRGTLSGSNYIGQYSDTYGYFDGGGLYNNGSVSQTVASYVTSDVIMVALGNGKLWWGKNGTWLGTGSPNPATATSPAFSGLSGDYFFGAMTYNSPYGGTWSANFGQRPFAYTPPTGFKPLHTGNLPDSAIENGSEYFDTVTYTGDGSANRVISGLEFTPDFIWIKNRNSTWDNILGNYLVTGGANTPITLVSNNNGAQVDGGYIGAQTTNSLKLALSAGENRTNGSGLTYVAWNWKANGAGVSNTDGSITSTVSANPTAGFSIVTYTEPSGTFSFGHGLGVEPAMFILKRRDGVESWIVWHKDLSTPPTNTATYLNATLGSSSAGSTWLNSVSSTVVQMTSGQFTGPGTKVAYCFADVGGYSKFGKYTGNGSTDGTFVYLGFRPAFVMVKRTNTTGNWAMSDNKREGYNKDNDPVYANLTNVEGTDDWVDFLSNGFKLRATTGDFNASGGTYIYMAFAESPFKHSLGR